MTVTILIGHLTEDILINMIDVWYMENYWTTTNGKALGGTKTGPFKYNKGLRKATLWDGAGTAILEINDFDFPPYHFHDDGTAKTGSAFYNVKDRPCASANTVGITLKRKKKTKYYKRRRTKMRNKYQRLLYQFTLPVLTILLFCTVLQAQSGGPFNIEQSVIAGGGETNLTGGQYSLGGTTGQSVAGQIATNPPMADHAGFWTPALFSPTAAQVSISGRVLTAEGQGIRGVRIVLTGGSVVRFAQTTTFGYYHFDSVQSGQVYVLEAGSKKFTFANSTLVLNAQDEITGADFIADPL
jgi:hypothetical protein